MSLRDLWISFKSEPIATIARWQDTRFPWILLATASLFMLILSHSVFQFWLYMQPCEHCVYIRFAFFCMALGSVFAAIKPRNSILKVLGYLLAFYGVIKGIGYCLKLNTIHQVVRSDDPFGVQGCSTEPDFPWGLPLDKWFSDWFKPTGECGFDSPIVPADVTLGGLQRWLVDYYADGWYVWPAAHFINMAQACMITLGTVLLILAVTALSWLITLRKAMV